MERRIVIPVSTQKDGPQQALQAYMRLPISQYVLIEV